MAEPTPQEWWESLTVDQRAEFGRAAKVGTLTAAQYQQMVEAGILIAAVEFVADPTTLTYDMPRPFAEYALDALARQKWGPVLAQLDPADRDWLFRETRHKRGIPRELADSLSTAGVDIHAWKFERAPGEPSFSIPEDFHAFLQTQAAEQLEG